MLRFGVVGTNYITDAFILSFVDVKDGKVNAIISRSLDKARDFAFKYKIDNYFDNYEEAIKSNTFDVIYIATPNSTHFEIAKYFINNNIPVIIEKPICLNDKETKELFALAKEKNVYICDALVPLYTDNFENIKKNLSLVGKLHRIDLVYSQYTKTWDIYLEDKSKTAYNLENGTGSLMAIGIYEVAFLHALFGKPLEVKAIGTLQENGVDHEVSALFKYQDFEATMHCARGVVSNNLNSIAGENGNIYFSTINRISNVYFEDRITKEIKDLTINDKTEMAYEIIDTINNINENNFESKKVPHNLSIEIMETMTNIRKQIGVLYKGE